MAEEYFVGLRATDDVVTDEREKSWRGGMMSLYPNGMVPLTGLTALMPSEKIGDPEYNWWERGLPAQKGTVSAVYDDASQTAYTDAADAVGFHHFWEITDDEAKEFRPGHIVLCRDASDLDADFRAEVVGVYPSSTADKNLVGTVSIEAVPTGKNAGSIDTLLIIGTANPEGGGRPQAISQSPEKRFNYTQIFRNSLDQTRTAMENKTIRPGALYKRAKAECLLLHGIEMEKGFLYGERTERTGANGKPLRTTRGLIKTIQAEGGTKAAFSGTWTTDGNLWMNQQLEKIFRYGGPERLAFCGSEALLGINNLAMEKGSYNIEAGETTWGLKIRTWITPFGNVVFVTHPLFSYEPSSRKQVVLFEPSRVKYMYVTDTMFKPDVLYGKGGGDGIDGKQEEYLTEGGLKIEFPKTGGVLTNIGG